MRGSRGSRRRSASSDREGLWLIEMPLSELLVAVLVSGAPIGDQLVSGRCINSYMFLPFGGPESTSVNLCCNDG
jgi:hypothetical protein